jgi:cbb3-type cytochrome oxidase subunit 3
MISSWLSDQGLLLGPAVALLLFLFVFIAVLVWIYRPGSTAIYEHEAGLPFSEGESGGADAPTTREWNHGKRA